MHRSRTSGLFLVWLVLLPTFAAVAAAGCSTAPDKRVLQYLNTQGFGKRYFGNAEEENYVTIGDTVQFADALEPAFRGAGTVGIDGTIMVPEVGPVHVAGLTRSEIEGLLTQKLAPYFQETDIEVQIAPRPKQFFVVGEVGAEGMRPFTGDLTVFEAVLAANPKEHTANLGRVQLLRPDPIDPLVIHVDVSRMKRTGDTTYNVLVQENDIVFVPPTMLKQLADFIAALFVPFTEVFKAIFQSIFFFNFGTFGPGKFGQNQFGGGIF